MASDFRQFPTYLDAVALARELYAAMAEWPSFDRWSVGLQLIRAVDSVAANIAEASGRWQPRDKKRLLVVARGSLVETEHWIETAYDRGLLEETPTDLTRRIAQGLSHLIDAQSRRQPSP